MKVVPYLFFEGRCEEAVDFYHQALGADVSKLMRFKESPEKPTCSPEGADDKIVHAEMRIGTSTIMVSDGLCDKNATFKGFSLNLETSDMAETTRLYGALLEGGKVLMPLEKTFWSPCFGMVTDRFGVSWMINLVEE